MARGNMVHNSNHSNKHKKQTQTKKFIYSSPLSDSKWIFSRGFSDFPLFINSAIFKFDSERPGNPVCWKVSQMNWDYYKCLKSSSKPFSNLGWSGMILLIHSFTNSDWGSFKTQGRLAANVLQATNNSRICLQQTRPFSSSYDPCEMFLFVAHLLSWTVVLS